MFKIHGHRLLCEAPAVCRQKDGFLRTQSCRQGRSSSLAIRASIRARWCIDIKYGAKLDAVSLVSEWVQNIGSQAGLSDNVHILSGAVGVPESRIEVSKHQLLSLLHTLQHTKRRLSFLFQSSRLRSIRLCSTPGTLDWCMQLEVEFDTLAELEHFWAAIPPQDHKAWSQRAQVHAIPPCLSWKIWPSTCLMYSAPTSPFTTPCHDI